MTEQDIVERLTDAQKRALLAMHEGKFYTPKEIGCSANTLWAMNPLGFDVATLQIGPILVTWDYREKGIRDWTLTATGLSVRALLEKQNG